jgi:hypothetical protein
VVAAVVLTAAPTIAQERGRVLGAVPFGTSPDRVTTAMADLGLTPSSLISAVSAFPLDQTFEGKVDGRHVLVTTMYDPHQSLEKMIVSFITADRDCVRFYREFKGGLIAEFGEAHADVEQWSAPYDDGQHVGHEQAAIRAGQGFLGATWTREDAGGTAGMSLSVDRNLTVTLTYESALWPRELERRRQVLQTLRSSGGPQRQ